MLGEELPAVASALEHERLLGSWYVLVTNHGFWRARTHPRVEHEALAGDPESVRSSLRFRQLDVLGREQRKVVTGVDLPDERGARIWRGEGLLRVIECRWTVPIVDPEHRWLIAWFGRTNLGMSGGLALHSKDPWLPAATVSAILDEVRAHPFLGGADPRGRPRCEGLRATTQEWIPPEPYRIEGPR